MLRMFLLMCLKLASISDKGLKNKCYLFKYYGSYFTSGSYYSFPNTGKLHIYDPSLYQQGSLDP